nr:hypothetical protein [Tanacetum cinerariifolium]
MDLQNQEVKDKQEKDKIGTKPDKNEKRGKAQQIDETDCYPKNEIHFTKILLYDNSSPHPPEKFVSKNSNTEIKSFSPSPILIKDSDSLIEEIDLSFTPDDPMPPGIEEYDHDSERDILILEELLDNYSLSVPVIESFHFDIPLFSHPPAKPADGSTGILNIKMMGDISEQKVPIPGLMITLDSNQEKSPDLLSHQGLKIFQPSAECPMMMCGKNTPILDVYLFHFYPLDQFKNSLFFCCMVLYVQYSRKCKDSYRRILSSKSSFPHLQSGNHNKLMKQMTSMCEMVDPLIQKKLEEKRIEEEQAATAQNRKLP